MDTAKRKYVPKEMRIEADFDNERPYHWDVIGLTKTDKVEDYYKNSIFIKESDYLYLYMDCLNGDYLFAEGVVIKNPYSTKPYKWCCKLVNGTEEYMSEYQKRFK